jgi:ornithine carbamoyltransferase
VEVADDVLDGRRSVTYDQAENRLWVQMAILEALVP